VEKSDFRAGDCTILIYGWDHKATGKFPPRSTPVTSYCLILSTNTQ
jgi:hypothetical protein